MIGDREPNDEPTAPRRRFAGPFVVLLIFGLSVIGVFGGELLRDTDPEGEIAPPIAADDLRTGERLDVDAGRPIVVYFMDAACEECGADLTELATAEERWSGKVTFVVVASGTREAVQRRFDASSALVVGFDDGSTRDDFGVEASPGVVFVGAGRRIEERAAAPIDPDRLERRIRSLVDEAP